MRRKNPNGEHICGCCASGGCVDHAGLPWTPPNPALKRHTPPWPNRLPALPGHVIAKCRGALCNAPPTFLNGQSVCGRYCRGLCCPEVCLRCGRPFDELTRHFCVPRRAPLELRAESDKAQTDPQRAPHSPVQHSTAQHSTAQHSTAQHSTTPRHAASVRATHSPPCRAP